MTKKTIYSIVTSIILPLFVPVFAQSFFSGHVEKMWETEAIFQVPESVYYDVDNEFIYVANINGNPSEKDTNGFISKLTANGELLELKWITGLNAPKGMGVYENKLYIADINQVVLYDLDMEEVIKKYDAMDAIFLNDVTIDDQGAVYISDMSTGAIHRIKNDSIEYFLPTGSFNGPNGLTWFNGELFVGTRDQIAGVNTTNKRIRKSFNVDGGIDGLCTYNNTGFIYSEWRGKVIVALPGRDPVLILDTSPEQINSADIFWIEESGILLIPTFYNNRVVAYIINDDN
nr:hypothetical protein [Bacteroidota bacterium]